jgi:hypothetical protein
MRAVVYVFPNLRYLTCTMDELLNPDAPIKSAVQTMESLYGKARIFPYANRIAFRDLVALAEVAGLSVRPIQSVQPIRQQGRAA